MIKTNNKAQQGNCQSIHSGKGARLVGRQPALMQLDEQMGASGLGPDHPWRLALSELAEAAGDTKRSAPASELLPHRPFSWLHQSLDGQPYAEFVTLVRDVCTGVAIIGDAAKMDGLCRDAGQPTLFTINDMESLEFLATRSLKMLAEAAERKIESLNDAAVAKEAA